MFFPPLVGGRKPGEGTKDLEEIYRRRFSGTHGIDQRLAMSNTAQSKSGQRRRMIFNSMNGICQGMLDWLATRGPCSRLSAIPRAQAKGA